MFRALKKSHDSEKRLVKRCRELNAEIVEGAAKVQAALKLSEEDQVGAGSQIVLTEFGCCLDACGFLGVGGADQT